MTRTKERAEDACPLVHQCRLPLSTRTVNHLADLLRRHLKAIRSRWRILPPGRIAVIVLAVLRHDQRLADMAGGNPDLGERGGQAGVMGPGVVRSSAGPEPGRR
ncbi:hypothetical protein ACF08M_39240 [Streptomyces sp. NPDC015032]|uniref:hypothetical protein n=1 Tax=Streptomyces sp. NPDC015032 TaxID=3364937 RepID=UPI0036F91311